MVGSECSSPKTIFCLGKSRVAVINPKTAKLINLNFHPLEVVCRYRDTQLKRLKITHICLI